VPVTPGTVVVEHVSRRFRVRDEPVLTLRDLLLRKGATRREIWALRDVSAAIEPGETVGLVGRNGSGKTTLLRLIAGIFGPTGGQISVGGSVGSLLELGAGFHPDFTGRENVYLNGAVHGLKRDYIRDRLEEIVEFAELQRFLDLPARTYSSGMYMRLGFAVATHLHADVLLLDEIFAVGDEAFQRKCFDKMMEFKRRGGTIVFVSHDAPAVERLCERTILLNQGRVEYDGATHEALARYHRLLATELDPDERAAGLREWGSGEVRITQVSLRDAGGAERTEFVAGEPLTVEATIVSERPVAPPVVSLEIRDMPGALFAGTSRETEELGWDESPGERRISFELDRLPLSEGRFSFGLSLADEGGGRLYHHVDRAVTFEVHPREPESRGAVHLVGRWSVVSERAELRR
jgi:ABC-type polysaccharide/polyol phosphate transport system ATPase subunit